MFFEFFGIVEQLVGEEGQLFILRVDGCVVIVIHLFFHFGGEFEMFEFSILIS